MLVYLLVVVYLPTRYNLNALILFEPHPVLYLLYLRYYSNTYFKIFGVSLFYNYKKYALRHCYT